MTDPMPLVGLIEIAMRAGVRRPVVSVWRTRYDAFPPPVAQLAVGPIFWWPDIERWLEATGRKVAAEWSREDTRVPSQKEKIARLKDGTSSREQQP